MSAYLVTREGQELGTFKTSKIEKGLKTGFFRVSDLGWRELSGWQGLAEIVGFDKAAALIKSAGPNPDDFNPSAEFIAHAQAGDSGLVAPAIIAELTRTRPWVRFIAVMMSIGCALMILVCLVLAADGARLSAPSLFSGCLHPLGLAVICALFTFLTLYPAVRLTHYASHIVRLAKSQSLADLAAALAEQRRFWTFYGIVMFISIASFFLLLIAGMGIRSLIG